LAFNTTALAYPLIAIGFVMTSFGSRASHATMAPC